MDVVLPALGQTSCLTDAISYLVRRSFKRPCRVVVMSRSTTVSDAVCDHTGSDSALVGCCRIARFEKLPRTHGFNIRRARCTCVLFLSSSVRYSYGLLGRRCGFLSRPSVTMITKKVARGCGGGPGSGGMNGFRFCATAPRQKFRVGRGRCMSRNKNKGCDVGGSVFLRINNISRCLGCKTTLCRRARVYLQMGRLKCGIFFGCSTRM